MSKKSQNVEMNPFRAGLLELLSRKAKEVIEEKGTSGSPIDELMPLDEIIENYQQLFNEKAPICIERDLMEVFQPKDFIDLNLARYYPKVYRGLPRLYFRDQPNQTKIKTHFTHLPSLKKQAIAKALFSLYSKMPTSGKVTLFTWVMNDGFGDFVAATEVMRLIKARIPEIDLHLVAILHEKLIKKIHFPQKTIVIPYKDEAPMITLEAFLLLAQSDLILQLPTFYPHTKELMEALPNSKWEMVGEYGFVESSWFHPKSDRYSLGLHFLEKGVLTRRPCIGSWDDIQNEKLKSWISFENRFYLAYLATPIGGAIYLHSLLKSLENDPLSIDLCVPDLGWFIAFAEKQMRLQRPILEWDMGISSIEIFFEDKFSSISVAPTGKKLRLLCPGALTQSDFRALLALSGDWVAIRGNQSFSEAVSQRKAFFYDGREHSRYFLKDFAAIAENRIGAFPSTLECIRGMLQGFLYNVSTQEDSWVDETYFQELEDWSAIALKIGLALQDPDTVSGFKRLASIITDEFSANAFLCHLVQRGLCHRQHPYVAELEAANVAKFGGCEMSFKDLIESQREVIDACQKNSQRQ